MAPCQNGEIDPERTWAAPNIFHSAASKVFQAVSLDGYNDLILGGDYAAAEVHRTDRRGRV